MPFASKAQARFMFSQKPQMAKEWAALTPSIKALPQHVKKAAGKRVGHRNDGEYQPNPTSLAGGPGSS